MNRNGIATGIGGGGGGKRTSGPLVPQLPQTIAEIREEFLPLLISLEADDSFTSNVYIMDLMLTLAHLDVHLRGEERRVFVRAYDRVLHHLLGKVESMRRMVARGRYLHHLLLSLAEACGEVEVALHEKAEHHHHSPHPPHHHDSTTTEARPHRTVERESSEHTALSPSRNGTDGSPMVTATVTAVASSASSFSSHSICDENELCGSPPLYRAETKQHIAACPLHTSNEHTPCSHQRRTHRDSQRETRSTTPRPPRQTALLLQLHQTKPALLDALEYLNTARSWGAEDAALLTELLRWTPGGRPTGAALHPPSSSPSGKLPVPSSHAPSMVHAHAVSPNNATNTNTNINTAAAAAGVALPSPALSSMTAASGIGPSPASSIGDPGTSIPPSPSIAPLSPKASTSSVPVVSAAGPEPLQDVGGLQPSFWWFAPSLLRLFVEDLLVPAAERAFRRAHSTSVGEIGGGTTVMKTDRQEDVFHRRPGENRRHETIAPFPTCFQRPSLLGSEPFPAASTQYNRLHASGPSPSAPTAPFRIEDLTPADVYDDLRIYLPSLRRSYTREWQRLLRAEPAIRHCFLSSRGMGVGGGGGLACGRGSGPVSNGSFCSVKSPFSLGGEAGGSAEGIGIDGGSNAGVVDLLGGHVEAEMLGGMQELLRLSSGIHRSGGAGIHGDDDDDPFLGHQKVRPGATAEERLRLWWAAEAEEDGPAAEHSVRSPAHKGGGRDTGSSSSHHHSHSGAAGKSVQMEMEARDVALHVFLQVVVSRCTATAAEAEDNLLVDAESVKSSPLHPPETSDVLSLSTSPTKGATAAPRGRRTPRIGPLAPTSLAVTPTCTPKSTSAGRSPSFTPQGRARPDDSSVVIASLPMASVMALPPSVAGTALQPHSNNDSGMRWSDKNSPLSSLSAPTYDDSEGGPRHSVREDQPLNERERSTRGRTEQVEEEATPLTDAGRQAGGTGETRKPAVQNFSILLSMQKEFKRLAELVSVGLTPLHRMQQQLRGEIALLTYRVISTIVDWLIPGVAAIDRSTWLFYRCWLCDLYAHLYSLDLLPVLVSMLNASGTSKLRAAADSAQQTPSTLEVDRVKQTQSPMKEEEEEQEDPTSGSSKNQAPHKSTKCTTSSATLGGPAVPSNEAIDRHEGENTPFSSRTISTSLGNRSREPTQDRRSAAPTTRHADPNITASGGGAGMSPSSSSSSFGHSSTLESARRRERQAATTTTTTTTSSPQPVNLTLKQVTQQAERKKQAKQQQPVPSSSAMRESPSKRRLLSSSISAREGKTIDRETTGKLRGSHTPALESGATSPPNPSPMATSPTDCNVGRLPVVRNEMPPPLTIEDVIVPGCSFFYYQTHSSFAMPSHGADVFPLGGRPSHPPPPPPSLQHHRMAGGMHYSDAAAGELLDSSTARGSGGARGTRMPPADEAVRAAMSLLDQSGSGFSIRVLPPEPLAPAVKKPPERAMRPFSSRTGAGTAAPSPSALKALPRETGSRGGKLGALSTSASSSASSFSARATKPKPAGAATGAAGQKTREPSSPQLLPNPTPHHGLPPAPLVDVSPPPPPPMFMVTRLMAAAVRGLDRDTLGALSAAFVGGNDETGRPRQRTVDATEAWRRKTSLPPPADPKGQAPRGNPPPVVLGIGSLNKGGDSDSTSRPTLSCPAHPAPRPLVRQENDEHHHHAFHYPQVSSAVDVVRLYKNTIQDAETLLNPHDPLRAGLVLRAAQFIITFASDLSPSPDQGAESTPHTTAEWWSTPAEGRGEANREMTHYFPPPSPPPVTSPFSTLPFTHSCEVAKDGQRYSSAEVSPSHESHHTDHCHSCCAALEEALELIQDYLVDVNEDQVVAPVHQMLDISSVLYPNPPTVTNPGGSVEPSALGSARARDRGPPLDEENAATSATRPVRKQPAFSVTDARSGARVTPSAATSSAPSTSPYRTPPPAPSLPGTAGAAVGGGGGGELSSSAPGGASVSFPNTGQTTLYCPVLTNVPSWYGSREHQQFMETVRVIQILSQDIEKTIAKIYEEKNGTEDIEEFNEEEEEVTEDEIN